MMTMIKFVCFLSLLCPVFGQGVMDPEQLENSRKLEGVEAANAYLELFQVETMTSDQLVKLGDAYYKNGRPIQALNVFMEAEKLDAESALVKERLKIAKERVQQKNKLLESFAQKEKETQNVEFLQRRCAVLFHLGYKRDAIELLSGGEETYGSSPIILGMLNSFKAGYNVDMRILRISLDEFKTALNGKDQKEALRALGAFIFFSEGRMNLEKLLGDLKATFGDSLNYEHIKAVGNLIV